MSKLQKMESQRLHECYYTMRHASGLPVYIFPKPESHATYAIFGTNYGSVDNVFRRSDEPELIHVPNGIAHYLEHKLFESEEGDAFTRYAKTGASANAYTSFDKTCYLFSASENVYDALEILLDFVQDPYFTEQTVAKEQGIIGQEIRMYDDDPGWSVEFNLLKALYHKHPVRIDIAGTVESIAQITPELLYRCYHTFYNLRNMALCVVGNVEPDRVLALCDKLLKPSEDVQVQRVFEPEPADIVRARVEKKGSVITPLFCCGFKEAAATRPSALDCACTEILLEALYGEGSPLYRRLLDQGLINASFGTSYFEGPGYACVMMEGESRDPDAVAQAVTEEADKARREGLQPQAFQMAQKVVYGRVVRGFNSVDSICNTLVSEAFAGRDIFAAADATAAATREQVQARLQSQLLPARRALSVVLPA